MKKLLFIAAIASAALVSCTKNEVAPSASEQQEITFANPVSHVVTKVDLVPTTYPTGSSFSVFADYHKLAYNTTGVTYTPYMRGSEGVVVTHMTETGATFDEYWAPENSYYWPKDGYLTFAAYSPAGVKDVATIDYNITNGVQITDYVVNTDPTKQIDLMLSNREVDETSDQMVTNNPAPYDGVQLTFNHVLSAIKFTVVTDIDYSTEANGKYTITLKSLKVKNAYTTGDLTQFAGIDNHNVAKNADDTPRTVWSNVDTEDATGYDLKVPSSGVTLSTSETTFSDSDDADLVLLPQALDHTSEAGNKVIAEVVYTVYHEDMGAVTNAIEYKSELELATTTVSTWDDGKRYIYNIKIGMDKVIFAPKVTAWDTQTEIKL